MEGAWFESTVASNDSMNTDTSEVHGELLYSYGERIFIAICWLLITIIGTTGNSMVIIAVICSRKLQTATNVFVVSLATADLLTNLFVFWSVVALLSPDGWILGMLHRFDYSWNDFEGQVTEASGGFLLPQSRLTSGIDFPESMPDKKLRVSIFSTNSGDDNQK